MIDEPKDRSPQQQPILSAAGDVSRYSENPGSTPSRRDHESPSGEAEDDQTSQAKAAAARAMDSEKSALARQLRGLAGAMEKVGSELRQSDQPALGRYTQQVGNSIGRLARDCEDRDLGEIASMAEDFGRKQPLAFLGIAAIAGLAASRFLTASAKRSGERSNIAPSNSSSTRREEGGWAFEKELRDA